MIKRLKKSRKADITLTPEFLFRIIIAILLFGFAIFILAKCFGTNLSQEAFSSYAELTEKIKLFNDRSIAGERSAPVLLTLDKDSTVVVYSNDSEETLVYVYTGEEGDSDHILAHVFPKPLACEGKSCVCLCRDDILTDGDTDKYSNLIKHSCADDSQFCEIYDFKIDGSCRHDESAGFIVCESGVVFFRDFEIHAYLADSARRRKVSIEKTLINGETVVGLCENPPCIKT